MAGAPAAIQNQEMTYFIGVSQRQDIRAEDKRAWVPSDHEATMILDLCKKKNKHLFCLSHQIWGIFVTGIWM